MTTPVPRTVSDCRLCNLVDDALNLLMRAMHEFDPTGGKALDQHVLAAMLSWWTANSLATTDDNPVPLFTVLVNALRDEGHAVRLEDLGSIDGPPPTRH